MSGADAGMELAPYWRCGAYTIDLSRPVVMGILNVTPDSFSDGGAYTDVEVALARGRQMVAEGAGIIDVGGESTRPGSDEVTPEEEARRVLPVVEALSQEGYVVSIDTRHAEVALLCVEAGASIINDVSGFRDPEMRAVAASCDAGLLVMHMRGEPKSMQSDTTYTDLVGEISDYLVDQAHLLEGMGVVPERICIDPGPGFGKDAQQNMELLAATGRLASLGYPLAAAFSRKSFLGALTGVKEADQRDASSVMVALLAAKRGARILRVHDVVGTVAALARSDWMLTPQEEDDRQQGRRTFIGLGSNMGDSQEILLEAMGAISQLEGTSLVAASSLYTSEPAFEEDQAEFLNAVLEVRTTREPLEFLACLQAIEREYGRVRSKLNGPRTLDLDLIDMEGVVSGDPVLTLPHPGTLLRDFVVTPLLELDSSLVLADGKLVTRDGIEYGAVTGKVLLSDAVTVVLADRASHLSFDPNALEAQELKTKAQLYGTDGTDGAADA